MPTEVIRSKLTHRVIGAAIEIHRTLGPGLLESVYKRCLAIEFTKAAIPYEAERDIPVRYGGVEITPAFRADFVVDVSLIVEVKAVEQLLAVHSAQAMTYLKLLGAAQALLINFNVPVLRHGLKSFLRRDAPPRSSSIPPRLHVDVDEW